MHGTNFEPQDITEWDKTYSDIDLIMHGSPCQDFSLAGKQAGGDKDSGTRSSLMYETIRIVEKNKPKYVIWENVKNLLGQKHRHNFDSYLETMSKLGYRNYYKVLNAKDYGIPQNRERVFTISIRNDIEKDFKFPEAQSLELTVVDLLETDVEEKFFLTDQNIKTYSREFGSKGKNLDGDIAPTLTASMGTGGGNMPYINTAVVVRKLGKEIVKPTDVSNTLMARGYKGLSNYDMTAVLSSGRLRRLTPKECWRLMGFDDSDFEKAKSVNSNSQLYKQAGNSIVVNVLQAIFRELL